MMSRPERRDLPEDDGPNLRDFMDTYRYLLVYIAVIVTIQIILMFTYYRP